MDMADKVNAQGNTERKTEENKDTQAALLSDQFRNKAIAEFIVSSSNEILENITSMQAFMTAQCYKPEAEPDVTKQKAPRSDTPKAINLKRNAHVSI